MAMTSARGGPARLVISARSSRGEFDPVAMTSARGSSCTARPRKVTGRRSSTRRRTQGDPTTAGHRGLTPHCIVCEPKSVQGVLVGGSATKYCTWQRVATSTNCVRKLYRTRVTHRGSRRPGCRAGTPLLRSLDRSWGSQRPGCRAPGSRGSPSSRKPGCHAPGCRAEIFFV